MTSTSPTTGLPWKGFEWKAFFIVKVRKEYKSIFIFLKKYLKSCLEIVRMYQKINYETASCGCGGCDKYRCLERCPCLKPCISLVKPGVVPHKDATTKSVVDIVSTDPNFSTLLSLVSAAGLVPSLQTLENAVIFAPTNAAFAAALQSLKLKPSDLTPELINTVIAPILKYHVALPDGNGGYCTLDGKKLSWVDKPFVSEVNGRGVSKYNIYDVSNNNTVVVLNSILIPPEGCYCRCNLHSGGCGCGCGCGNLFRAW